MCDLQVINLYVGVLKLVVEISERCGILTQTDSSELLSQAINIFMTLADASKS